MNDDSGNDKQEEYEGVGGVGFNGEEENRSANPNDGGQQSGNGNNGDGNQSGNGSNLLDKAMDFHDTIEDAKKTKENLEKAKKVADGAKVAKDAAAAAETASAAVTIGWIIFWVAVVILVIIIIVGLICFFVFMPGQVAGRLKEMGIKFLDAVQGIIVGDENVVHGAEISEIANYLESMGYDLKGEGFVTGDIQDNMSAYSKNENPPENSHLDEQQGVYRSNEKDEKVVAIYSEPIWTYIVSDNLNYLVKNFNVNLKTANDENGITRLFTKFLSISDFIISPITKFSSLFSFSAISNPNWGTGLISIWHEDGEIGKRGSYYGQVEAGYISLDKETKQLKIQRGWTNNPYVYDVDGWSGRYGMPLEFLLSVHIATQMPDLAMEMATAFDTDVQVLLHEVEGGIIAGYRVDSGDYITWNQVMGIFREDESFLETIWNNANNSKFTKFIFQGPILSIMDSDEKVSYSVSDREYCKLFQIGLPHSDGCQCCKHVPGAKGTGDEVCEDTGDLTIKENFEKSGHVVCEACKQNINEIISALKQVQDNNYKSYVPYISQVKNHWFRDVYFVINDVNNTDIVLNDEAYFYQTNERWTLYETYTEADEKAGNIPEGFAVGDYKLYEYNESTNEYKLFKGSKSEAESINEKIAQGDTSVSRLVKKSLTKKITDIENISGLNDAKTKWTAYKFENNSTDWTKIETTGDAGELVEKYKDRLYYKEDRINDIVQIEDGQRGPTNSKIKKMFINNKYYQYDGTINKADLIIADREKNPKLYDNTKNGEKVQTSNNNKVTSPGDNRDQSLLGKVSINKDSLRAFAMLENTHTLDADYIYKDFKELIVELNYFDKEELSDKIDKVLTWPLPDSGSSGWPIRAYQKGETFYGTLINSKVDLELLQKAQEREFEQYDFELDEGGLGEIYEDEENFEEAILINENNSIIQTITDKNSIDSNSKNFSGNIAKIDLVGKVKRFFASINEIKDAKFYSGTKINSPVFPLDKGVHTFDNANFNGVNYAQLWQQSKKTCTLYSAAFLLQQYTNKTFEQCIVDSNGNRIVGGGNKSNRYWTAGVGVSWNNIAEDLNANLYINNVSFDTISTALNQGIPVYIWTHYGTRNDRHAVVLLGKHDGNLYLYDPTYGNIVKYKYSSGYQNQLEHLYNNYIKGQNRIRVIIPNEPPKGSNVANLFEGYEGDQVVVSPVTGKVVEYGTVKRPNVETGVEEEVEFIKIEAIDNYLHNVKDSIKDSGKGYEKCTKITDTFEEKASSEDKKYEGYDYFYDEYSGVLNGYVLYMEGFDLTLFDSAGKSSISGIHTYEPGSINLEKYKDASSSDISRYEENTVYNMTDDLEEARSWWKEDAKASALPLMEINGELYIKEGTVIGKTRSDEDLMKNIDKDTATCNGNYMRLILRNLDDSIVEDVENYFDIKDVYSFSGSAVEIQGIDGMDQTLAALIEKNAGPLESKYPGIVNILKAISMNESSGGKNPDCKDDPMQAAESLGKKAGSSIGGMENSVNAGIKALTNAWDKAVGYGINDVRVVIQAYNYGSGFVDYVHNQGSGTYTKKLAEDFSAMWKKQLGWSVYGDPDYVDPKIYKYLPDLNV